MDNRKIGKLIAELRKKQGLTQQELGDMVGVGFKAVSKWECGTTLPDITIINEVSKILGITTDELLTGELKEEPPVEEQEEIKEKKTISPKLIITISIITVLLIFITTIFVYQNNRTYTHNLISNEETEYYVEGKIFFNKNNISIDKITIRFKDEEFQNIIIKNYEYTIYIKNKLIFGYGYMDSMNALEEPTSIGELIKNIKISYAGSSQISYEEYLKNDLVIKFKFLTEKNKEIIKELKLVLD